MINTSEDVLVGSPSKSQGHAQVSVRGGVYLDGRESTAPGANSPVLCRDAESASPKTKQKEPSDPRVAAAASLPKASLALAGHNPKPSTSPKGPKLTSPVSPAGVKSKDKPKNRPPKRGRLKSGVLRSKQHKAPGEPHLVSTPRAPATAQPPTMVETPERASLGRESTPAGHGEPSSEPQPSSGPAESSPAACPEETQPLSGESRESARPPATGEATAIERLRAVPETPARAAFSREMNRPVPTGRPEQAEPTTGTAGPRAQSAPPGATSSTAAAHRREGPEGRASISDGTAVSTPRARSASPETRPPLRRPGIWQRLGLLLCRKSERP